MRGNSGPTRVAYAIGTYGDIEEGGEPCYRKWHVNFALRLNLSAVTFSPETKTFTVNAQQEEYAQMWRLYNPNSGEHFYTTSVEERDQLVAAGWRNEGVGFYGEA